MVTKGICRLNVRAEAGRRVAKEKAAMSSVAAAESLFREIRLRRLHAEPRSLTHF